MLAGGLIIAAVFAFLIYRIVTRIILPELKFRDDPLSDKSCGDWPHVPTTDVPLFHEAGGSDA